MYQDPKLYDTLMAPGTAREAKFLDDCFTEHAIGPVKRTLEPACGSGRLLAALGKKGYEPHGFDLAPEQVEYCNARLARLELPGDAWVDDMQKFTPRGKYCAIYNTVNSFRHLLTERGARAHLRAAADCLREGGLFVVGLHLMPNTPSRVSSETWTSGRGKLRVRCRISSAQIEDRVETCDVKVTRPSSSEPPLHSTIQLRTYSAGEILKTFASEPRLSTVALYSFTYKKRRGIELEPWHEDSIFVLRKSGE